MSRILRRPLFRGGSANEGVMSVPRKGYADSDEEGVQPEEDNIIDTVASSQRDTSNNKMLQQLLADRPDPLGKFLIDFGLDLMSRPASRGKLGFLTTAAKAAKAPTKQLYSDLDTERAFNLKLYSALNPKDSENMRIARAYAKKYGGTPEDYIATLAKRKIDSSDLKDLSPAAIVRKYATEASKSRDFQDDPVAQRNIGIFRLRVEQDKVDKNVLNSLAPGNPYLAPDLVKRSSENKNILEFSPTATEQDRKVYNESYIYVNPTDRGFYQIKEINKKRVFVRIGEFN
jgi:hypothetical protein